MLGKQWLNRYASTEMRGTAIERSQYRQRKLDGIVKWYFDHVMESLPLMLQVALLLLGCTLSRYLWEINVTVASVVLAVTSFGVIFYIFVVVAGAISVICPYQTPGARVLRHILLPTLRSTSSTISKLSTSISSRFSYFIEASFCRRLTDRWWSSLKQPWYTMFNVAISLAYALVVLPIALVADVCLLGGLMHWLLVGFGKTVFYQLPAVLSVIVSCSVTFGKAVYRRFPGTFSAQTHNLDRQTIALDLRCISWMLRTSLDKTVHLTALKHLATMVTLSSPDSTLVSGCFDVFIDCIKVNVNTHNFVVIQGLEELAAVSAMCFLRTFHHLLVMDPTSPVLEDVRQRYSGIFPSGTVFNFTNLPFCSTMIMICSLADRSWHPRCTRWGRWRPSAQECISFTRGMAEIVQAKYQQMRHRKVPRWALRFALLSLALEPLPPASVVADCLSIIAIDLGCEVPSTGFAVSDERSVSISQISTTLTLNQCTGGASCEPDMS
jgi:hypothetical protein